MQRRFLIAVVEIRGHVHDGQNPLLLHDIQSVISVISDAALSEMTFNPEGVA
jgi:hypothetical protein